MALPPDQPDYTVPTLGPISKESRLSWHSQLSNHGRTPAWRRVTGNFREGKFFPRGCRGHISAIQVYCRNTILAADTITVRISPQPDMGPTYTATIALVGGEAAAWRPAIFNLMWNYDSLFIFIVTASNRAEWAYDDGAPYDYYLWDLANFWWLPGNFRLWIRVTFTGETAGDVPVSGTVNVIEIPAVSSRLEKEALNVASGVTTRILELEGSGTLLQAELRFATLVVPSATIFYAISIEADGGLASWFTNRQATQSLVAAFGRCSCGEFYQGADPDYPYTHLFLRVPVKFRRTLALNAWQSTGALVNVLGWLSPNLTQ